MSTKHRLLVVEDDDSKLRALVDFLAETCGRDAVEIVEAKSHSSATRAVERGGFDLAILDMSLPSFDLAKDTQGGGPPLGFGGRELLRLLEAEAPCTRAIVVTQYPAFSETERGERASFPELQQQLKEEFGDQFLGMVYYEGKQGAWRNEIKGLLASQGLGQKSS